jgi:hypothetical protein
MREEATALIERMTDELGKGTHGPKWMEARIDELKVLEAKQGHYEELLGGRLADVTAARELLNANLSAAMFAAMAQEDAA